MEPVFGTLLRVSFGYHLDGEVIARWWRKIAVFILATRVAVRPSLALHAVFAVIFTPDRYVCVVAF
jgi:hypothetical protein